MDPSKSPTEGGLSAGPTAEGRGPIKRHRRGTEGVAVREQPFRTGGTVDRGQEGLLPDHFRQVRELGRGAMGVVYRALDSTMGREVAVKVLPPTITDSDRTKRFQRESSDLASLSHPNVVGFYSIGQHNERDFLVMELVEGGDLNDFVERKPNIRQIIKMFAQISEGLEHIHSHGIVHRDLKPENVLLTPAGVPKITDFGLARRIEKDRSRLTTDGTILGTFTYLAPEQILSSEVGPPADLYALGACLYETLTGKPMFVAETEFSLLNSHLREIPRAPSSDRPDCPPALETLVMRLVKKSPEERPRSAREVASELRALLAEEDPVRHGLLGRDSEVSELFDLATGVKSGQGVALMLTAPHGQGRSRLVRELLPRLKAAGIRVLEVFPRANALLPLAEVYASLDGQADDFCQLMNQAGPAAAVFSLRQLMAKCAPVLLVADDLARMDASTGEQLRALVSMTPPPGAGWLVSCGASRAASLTPSPGTQVVELVPLGPQHLTIVAQELLSTWPEGQGEGGLEDSLVQWLCARAGGSVRRVRLLLLSLRGARALQFKNHLWRRAEGVALPSQINEAIMLEIDRLGEEQLKLLRTASLLEEPLPFEWLQQGGGLTEEEAETALESLVKLGLLEETWTADGEQYIFASPEIRESLAQNLSERSRRRLHAKLAQTLAAQNANPSLVGLHLAQAQQLSEALPLLLEGAERMQGRGAFADALPLWQRAQASLPPEAPAELRLRIQVATADCLARIGRAEEGVSLLEGAMARVGAVAPADLLRASQRLAELKAQSPQGTLPEGRQKILELCRRALSEAKLPLAPNDPLQDHPLRQAALGIYKRMAVTLRDTGERRTALHFVEASLPAADAADISELKLMRGVLLRELGDVDAALQSLEEARDASLGPYHAMKVGCEVGITCLVKGDSKSLEQAEESLKAALQVAEELLDPQWQATLLGHLAELHTQLNQLPQALEARQQAVERLRPTPLLGALALALVRLGDAHLERNQLPEAETTYREALHVCGQFQGDRVAMEASWGLGRLCQKRERKNEAAEWFRETTKLAQRLEEPVRHSRALTSLAQILLQQGHVEESLKASTQAVELVSRLDFSYECGLALGARGAAMLALKHLEEAEECSRQALAKLSDMPGGLATRNLKKSRVKALVEVQETLEQIRKLRGSGEEAPTLVEVAPSSPKIALKEEEPPVPPPVQESKPRPAPPPPRPQPVAPPPPVPAEAKAPAPPPGGLPKFALAGLAGIVLVGVGLLALRQPSSPPQPQPTGAAVVTPVDTPVDTPAPVQTPAPVESPAETPSAVAPVLGAGLEGGTITVLDAAGKKLAEGPAPFTPEALPAGKYFIKAAKPGFVASKVPWDGSSAPPPLELTALGAFEVTLAPVPAVVKVDGQPQRATTSPFRFELPPGKHKLTFSAGGYTPESREVEVTSGQNVTVPEVKLVKAVATLTVRTNRSGARVFLDGQEKGETAKKGGEPFLTMTDLRPGGHELKIVLDGYETYRKKISLEGGKEKKEQANLIELPPPPPPVDYPPDPGPAPVYPDPAPPPPRQPDPVELPHF